MWTRLLWVAFSFLLALPHVHADTCNVNVTTSLLSFQSQITTNAAELNVVSNTLGLNFNPSASTGPYLDSNTIFLGESTCWDRYDFVMAAWNNYKGAFHHINPMRNWCLGGQSMASAKTWATLAPITPQYSGFQPSGSSAWTLLTTLSFLHVQNQTGNFVVMYGINDYTAWNAHGLGTNLYLRAYAAFYNVLANWDGRVLPRSQQGFTPNSFPDSPLLGGFAPTFTYVTNGQSRICVVYADSGSPFVPMTILLANGTTISVPMTFTAQGNPGYGINYIWIPATANFSISGVSGNAGPLAVVQEVAAKRKVVFIVPSAWSGVVQGQTANAPTQGGHGFVLNAVQTLGLNYFDFSSLVVDTYDNVHPGPLSNAAISQFMNSVNQTQIATSFFLP